MISCIQMEELLRAMPLNSITHLRSLLIPFRRLRNPLPSFPSRSSTTGTSAKESGLKLAAVLRILGRNGRTSIAVNICFLVSNMNLF